MKCSILPQPIGLFKLLRNILPMYIFIQVIELYLGHEMGSIFSIGLHSNTHLLISCKFGLMIDISILYSLCQFE